MGLGACGVVALEAASGEVRGKDPWKEDEGCPGVLDRNWVCPVRNGLLASAPG